MALSTELVGAGMPAGTAQAMGGIPTAVTATASSTQATAVQIAAGVNRVTGADGVRLPAAQPGDSVIIINDTGSTIKVWPPVGAAIGVPGTSFGSATANASYAHTTYAVVRYTCYSATLWAVNKSA